MEDVLSGGQRTFGIFFFKYKIVKNKSMDFFATEVNKGKKRKKNYSTAKINILKRMSETHNMTKNHEHLLYKDICLCEFFKFSK